jgi:asparagine synthase (glutamine-hydrolysing)
MCGIAGMVLRGQPVDTGLFTAMVDTMTHRGPDDRGIWTEGHVALGMRRLSIIDVAHGHQPLHSTDGAVVCVGNGELYDHRAHRQSIMAAGRTLATSSDIEIAPHMLQMHGELFIQRIEGMFGLALFDRPNHRLYVYRDRMGIKPMFYSATAGHVVFASDVNVILRSGLVRPEADPVALDHYYSSRFGAGCGLTFFKGIQALLPGQYLVIDTDTLHTEVREFSHFMQLDRSPLDQLSLNEAADRLDHLLRESVRKRLMSEVPLGTLLSSGIDSSLLTAMANRLLGADIDAFTVSYDDPRADETAEAAFTARHLGIQLHPCKVSSAQYAELLPTAVLRHEGPLSHPNSVPVHMVTQLARDKGYKVLLSGEGADELFAGYGRTHNLSRLQAISNRYPAILLRLLSAAGLKFDAREAAMLAAISDKDMRALAKGYFSVAKGERKNAADPLFDALADQVRPDHLLNDMLQLEQHTYLQELLLRQDKMSMWSSMEVRVPFVGDPAVVAFANTLPFGLKYDNLRNKKVLRLVAERYLPKEVCYRPKRGFGSPIGAWLRSKDGLGALADKLATEAVLDSASMKRYRSALAEHRSGKSDHEEFLFKSMCHMLWAKAYLT